MQLFEVCYNYQQSGDYMSTRLGLSLEEDAMRALIRAVRSGAHLVEFDEWTEAPKLYLIKVTTDDRGVIVESVFIEEVDLEEENFFKDKRAEQLAEEEARDALLNGQE